MAQTVTNDEFKVDVDNIPTTRKMLTIFIDEEKGKPNHEFVGVNGNFFQIKRGVEVEVPEEVVGVLRNSVATRYVPTTDPTTGAITLTPQQYYLTPFRVIK